MSEMVQLDIFTVTVADIEEWRCIPGWEDEYEVSSWGRIRSVDRVDRLGHRRKSRMLKPEKNNKGYIRIGLRTDAGSISILVHRLVALAFIGPPPTPEHQVNHIDGDKTRNELENLEWTTRLENLQHAKNVLGRRLGALGGEQNYNAKMTAAQVEEARRRYTGKYGEITQLAQELGVPYQALQKAIRGESWRQV